MKFCNTLLIFSDAFTIFVEVGFVLHRSDFKELRHVGGPVGEHAGGQGTAGVAVMGLDKRVELVDFIVVLEQSQFHHVHIHIIVGIAAPEVLEATEVSKSSFTANWESVAKATSYNVDLFKCETVESDTPSHVILFEDFSNVTSDRTPDNPKLITDIDMANLDYYTQRKGWEGNGNVIADGMMGCTGNRNYELKLLTPYITLGNGGGDYTVKMKVYSYAGETLVVQATDCYATYDFETDGMHEFEFNMFSGTMKDRLQIYTLNAKTFLVDEITVSQNVKAGDVLLEYVRTQSEAEGNSFTFDNMSDNSDYAYIVRSNYKRFTDKCESGHSEVMKVNFKNSVSDIAAAQAITVSVSGRTISVESPVAAQLYSADGRLIMSAPASFNHTVAAPGVYIVKAGNNYRKVAVK